MTGQFLRFMSTVSIGTLRSNEATATRSKKRFNKQNNNFARTSHFFVHFFAVLALLRRENVYNFAFYGERKQAMTKFYFSFWTLIWSLGIQIRRVGLHLTKQVVGNNRDKD